MAIATVAAVVVFFLSLACYGRNDAVYTMIVTVHLKRPTAMTNKCYEISMFSIHQLRLDNAAAPNTDPLIDATIPSIRH